MLHRDYLPHGADLEALQKAALRSRSTQIREVLARRATGGQSSFAELIQASISGRFDVAPDPEALRTLARVLALQALDPQDRHLALTLFAAVPPSALSGDFLSTYARLLLTEGEHERLSELLTSHTTQLAEDDTLHLSLVNPALGSPWADAELWSDRLTGVLAARGLTATSAAQAPGTPAFDSVLADRAGMTQRGGQLVSVVMTTYRPGPTLLQSVRSITEQTWGDLEIILVDDCSGPGYDEILAEAAGMDGRVRLVRLDRNVGTYGARNAALARATGEFVTGQDDDDWAHPRRIERQLEPLLSEPSLPATLSRAVWASDDLEIAPLGWPSIGKYAPSYLVRRELVDRAGRYLEGARKAADTELMRRVEAMTRTETHLLPEALSLYRTRPGSLSRDDFAPGWDHPARVTFWQLSARVHDRIRRGQVEARSSLTEIAVPTRFMAQTASRSAYDVIVMADFRTPPGRGGETPFTDEVKALAAEGLRVAVLQLDDVRTTGSRNGPVDSRLLDEVNSRRIDRVHLDDEVDTHLLLVRSLGLLQYAPAGKSTISATRLVAVADEPATVGTTSGAYNLGHCVREARRLFNSEAAIMGFDEVLRQQARTAAADSRQEKFEVIDHVYLGATATAHVSSQTALRGPLVLGALASWPGSLPADSQVLSQILPAAHPGSIRVRGRSRDLSTLGPVVDAWQIISPEEQSVRAFLDGIDVLVHFPDRTDPGPELAEAFAAGVVVVTHPRFKARLGNAAVYTWPSHAAHTYARLGRHSTHKLARAQSIERARMVTPAALVQRLGCVGK